MNKDALTYIFSGCTGCGKTSISKPFAEAHALRWTSFGNAVRTEATSLGLAANDIGVLQQLGQEMVDHQPERLCGIVTANLDSGSEIAGVLDGLRHKRILDLLRETIGKEKCRVIFVDAERSVRHSRLQRNRGWTAQQCVDYDNSATEVEVEGSLRPIADLIIDNNGSLDASMEQLQRWVDGG